MVANTWYTPPNLSRNATGPDGAPDPRTQIGVVAPNYGLEHVTYLLEMERYRHVEVRRLPLHRLERGGSTFWDKTPVVLRAGVPLVHTFNMAPMSGPPFVMTFEMELPYYLGRHRAWQHKIGHAILASDRCRGLLSFSDTAADLARAKFEALGRSDIASKISTFRGGVRASATPGPRTDLDGTGPLRLLFVGADAIRKSLLPLLEAVEDLRNAGAEVELTVVSSLVPRSYVAGDHEPPVSDIRARLERPWITYHPSLPYPEVRQAMRHHDLLMLPSLDETLGWVVIEAAMEGIGSVTTNAFALPELVEDGKTGRVLNLPLNAGKRWAGLFQPNRRVPFMDAMDQLHEDLRSVLEDVLNARHLVADWGQAAHDKLTPLYHPDVASKDLSDIYDRALQA